MNNMERFILHFGTIIQSGNITPVDKYFNHTDWYLGYEIWELMPTGFCLAPYEMKELSDKPALIQRMEFINAEHENHTIYRMTKAGWKLFEDLTGQIEQQNEEQEVQEEPKTEPVVETVPAPDPEKDKKILWYVPWCKADAIYSCWKDSDGYWIMLNEGWNADRMDGNCRTIHENTIYDLKYQIGGIRKVV